jgi:serine/threonine protein kinase
MSANLCGKIFCISQGISDEGTFAPYIIQEYFPKTLSRYLIETVTSHSESIKFSKELSFLMLIRKLCVKLSSLRTPSSSELFEFSHRDMKADNIMLTYDGKGHVNDIFLIDFGYSCVNINGYKLGQNNALFGKAKCHRSSRDLSFLIFSIYYNLRKTGLNFTPVTERFIKWLLSFKIKDKICEPYNGCDYEISNDYDKMDYGTL